MNLKLMEVRDFNDKYESYVGNTADIFIAMLAFGLWRAIREILEGDENFYNPIKDKLKDQWDYNVLLDSDNASDEEDEDDLIWTKEGLDFVSYKLSKAIKFERPSWVFGYLIGEVMGMKISEELQEHDVREYLKLLPKQIVQEHGAKVVVSADTFSSELGLTIRMNDYDLLVSAND